MEQEIGIARRMALSLVAFFAVLFNRDFAQGVFRLRQSQQAALPPPPREQPVPESSAPVAGVSDGTKDRRDALHLLSMLQRDGRLIDFLQEEIAGYSDAEVGAAARAVHQGCRKSMQSYFSLEPVYREPEGASVSVAKGFDASAVRLTGNLVGEPPFRGSLKHHGWRVKEVKMPSVPPGQDPAIVAPAEVELT